jgi:hypothetical protein
MSHTPVQPHSPLPWVNDHLMIRDSDLHAVAQVYYPEYAHDVGMEQANAALIVRCVNDFAALEAQRDGLARDLEYLNSESAADLAYMSRQIVDTEAQRDEALATIARLERDKDHLLTKADGDYLRERLGEMVELEAERDALLAALRDLADTNNDFSEALVRARSAIARATTGEKS